ncbi:thioredoxin-dependent thiol peroxidase [Helicobacter mehlei]|uniref:thioredoxin-dependent thiol peroxidase n=1 Tax=Helicobacter mehlei TaxID=2316080 RepID=UPI000EAFEED9|nr:thioredoxin-dependent thiol peroxidase [Helicobacter mehlei]
MTLQFGHKAPNFSLLDSQGKQVSLQDLRGQKVVLYFYPKDNTPGCTLEARDFTQLKTQFQQRGAVIIGISPDDTKSHCHFIESEQLGITLLSDPHLETIKAYGAYGVKNMYGKQIEGVIRSTFVIDEEGVILHALYNVRAKDHAKRVLVLL